MTRWIEINLSLRLGEIQPLEFKVTASSPLISYATVTLSGKTCLAKSHQSSLYRKKTSYYNQTPTYKETPTNISNAFLMLSAKDLAIKQVARFFSAPLAQIILTERSSSGSVLYFHYADASNERSNSAQSPLSLRQAKRPKSVQTLV